MIEELTPRQRETILAANRRLNIWSGSVRSGKTVASQISWIKKLRYGPAGPLLMVGKTVRTLKRNVLDPLEEFLGPTRMKVNVGNGEAMILGRRVYLAGANDDRAESKIRGLTLAGAYGDELTTWPRGFFQMLLSRLSLQRAFLDGTTNADAPLHWLKKDFLDRRDVLQLNSFEFKLEDNTFLDPEYIASLKVEYTGLWYKRFILGLWVAAEGPIYDMLLDEHFIAKLPKGVEIKRYWLGVDYGTSNPFVALLFGRGSDGVTYVLDEYRYDSRAVGAQKSDTQYRTEVEAWLKKKELRPAVETAWVDPSAASFIVECGEGWLNASQADNSVVDGIRFVSSMLAKKELRILTKECPGLSAELPGYVWDPRAQQKGKDEPLKVDDHGPDALRYGLYSEAQFGFDPSLTGWS